MICEKKSDEVKRNERERERMRDLTLLEKNHTINLA
jgi:hypothetical protein